MPGQGTDVTAPGHAAAGQRHVLERGAVGTDRVAEQAHIVGQRTGNRQAADGVAQAIEIAGKVVRCGDFSNRIEAGASVPGAGGRGVNIAAQRVVPGQVAVHALQIGAAGAAGNAQGGEHGIVDQHAVRAKLGAEILARRQVDRRQHIVGAGVAGSDSALAVFQGQRGAAGAVHGAVDLNVVLGIQREPVGRPIDGVGHDHVTLSGRRVAAPGRAKDGHIAAGQLGAQRGAGNVAAGGGNDEVDRIDQPSARATARGGSRHAHSVVDAHMGGRGFDEAAVARVRRAGVKQAASLHGAALRAAQQPDGAVAVLEGVRADHASVVDRVFHQVAGRLCAEQDLAAVSLDQAAVLHQRVERAPVDGDVE